MHTNYRSERLYTPAYFSWMLFEEAVEYAASFQRALIEDYRTAVYRFWRWSPPVSLPIPANETSDDFTTLTNLPLTPVPEQRLAS